MWHTQLYNPLMWFFNLIGEKVIQKASQTLFLQEIITVTGELSLFHKVQISTQMMNFHSLFMDFFNNYYFLIIKSTKLYSVSIWVSHNFEAKGIRRAFPIRKSPLWSN